MNELKQLITEKYPLSDSAWDVTQRSMNAAFQRSNTVNGLNSFDLALLPVFLSKFLSQLENAGVTVESLDTPFITTQSPSGKGVNTLRFSYFFGQLLDAIGSQYIEEEVISASIEDIVNHISSKTKKISIYTIEPEVDKTEFKFNVYIRGEHE